MKTCSGRLKWIGAVSVLALAGCSESPSDQFKPISELKKNRLTMVLENKESRLLGFKATVTVEPDVERRSEATHVGLVDFCYPVTRPVGEHESQGVDTVVAEYRFLAKERKWVYIGCRLKQPGITPMEENERLVTFAEVTAIFEKSQN